MVNDPQTLATLSTQITQLQQELKAIKTKLCATAAEYQREPRWVRSTEVGKMLEEWANG
jgi:hypothetical protein